MLGMQAATFLSSGWGAPHSSKEVWPAWDGRINRGPLMGSPGITEMLDPTRHVLLRLQLKKLRTQHQLLGGSGDGLFTNLCGGSADSCWEPLCS